MSSAREVLPVLLGFEREDDSLSVVVDTDPESAKPDAASILTLRFIGCAATDEARAELDGVEAALAEGVGEPFEWTVTEGDAEFYIDYGAVGGGVLFSSLSETSEPPTPDLIHQRVARLASWTDDLTERFWNLDRRHNALLRALEREAERETDRAARKLPFLRERGSASAEAVEARAAAFERVQQIVHQNQHPPK